MKLIVIGNGMVGQRLLEQLQAAASNFEITVLCEESRPAYDRVHLTSYFSGKSAQDLSLAAPDFFDRSGISLQLSERAVAIDRGRCVVIGGGLLGLEAAKALKDLGLETHVVEFAPRLMAVQIDDAGGSMLLGRIRDLGVGVHTGKQTTAIVDGSERAHCLRFADGSVLETDLIVFSAGIRPRDEVARAAGLEVGGRGGVVIDDACRTSDPDIFAIG